MWTQNNILFQLLNLIFAKKQGCFDSPTHLLICFFFGILELKSSIILDHGFCHFWLRFHRKAECARWMSHCIHIRGSLKLFDIHSRICVHSLNIHSHYHCNSPIPHFPYSCIWRCPKSQDYKRLRFDSWIDRKLVDVVHQDIHPRYFRASNIRKNGDNRDCRWGILRGGLVFH